MSDLLQWFGGSLLILGALLTFIAALALIRFPDLLSRQHAATKPQVLGLVFMVTGSVFIVQDARLGWTVMLVIAFQLITAPISAHMLSRAGYRTGRVTSADLVVDEMGEDLRVSDDQIGPGATQ